MNIYQIRNKNLAKFRRRNIKKSIRRSILDQDLDLRRNQENDLVANVDLVIVKVQNHQDNNLKIIHIKKKIVY